MHSYSCVNRIVRWFGLNVNPLPAVNCFQAIAEGELIREARHCPAETYEPVLPVVRKFPGRLRLTLYVGLWLRFPGTAFGHYRAIKRCSSWRGLGRGLDGQR